MGAGHCPWGGYTKNHADRSIGCTGEVVTDGHTDTQKESQTIIMDTMLSAEILVLRAGSGFILDIKYSMAKITEATPCYLMRVWCPSNGKLHSS